MPPRLLTLMMRPRPRARYAVPRSARLGIAVLRALPTRWADAILRRVTRMDRKHLTAAPVASGQLGTGGAPVT